MVIFREFSGEHVEVIASMMKQFNAIDDYPFNKQERVANLQQLLKNPEYGRLWLIEQDQKVAGYAFLGFGFSFEFKGRDAFVDELFILPEFQGQGLGNQAIDFVVAEAAKAGVRVLHLEAEHHNERALNLYRKKGFTDHKRFLLSKYL